MYKLTLKQINLVDVLQLFGALLSPCVIHIYKYIYNYIYLNQCYSRSTIQNQYGELIDFAAIIECYLYHQ